MHIRTLTLIAASCAALFAQSPVPPTAAEQQPILNRIGRELNRNLPARSDSRSQGYTFTYRPGSRPNTAILILNKGC